MSGLQGRKIVLGIGGGIAAYKSPDLVRRLAERGAEVQVVMTAGARRFVTALTFQAVSHRSVRCELWDTQAEAAMGHLELARWADLVLVAPATANLIARLAHGLADDLLATLVLATEAPVVLAPAMNQRMWRHPATGANVALLAERGVRFIGPEEGPLAEGESGPGRMSEPESIAAALAGAGPLAGRHVLVSAGPTREPIDPVRYIGNRSSGKMGFAVARAAAAAGAEVTLVSGPTGLAAPPGIELVPVGTAAEMADAVLQHAAQADVFVSAAAVADYAPASPAERKIKKHAGRLTLELERTPDILAAVAARKPRPYCVGFAAETEDVLANARTKLETKKLDLICANRVGTGSGFDTDDNALVALEADRETDLGRAPKRVLAERLVALIAERLQGRT